MPDPPPPSKPPLTPSDPRKMKIVPASSYTTPFELPSDWIVQVRPRPPNSPISSDKYYYEPGTGRKFRSLASIRRYLNGEPNPTPTKKPRNCLVVLRPDELKEASDTTLAEVRPKTLQFRSADTLPDGWIVEEIPRKCGFRSDRYFIDPVSGQKFRSMPEVHRFLEGVDEKRYKSKRKASRSSAPQKNTSVEAFNDTLLDLMTSPKKINWVYSGDGKDNWSPLVEECVLPNYVMEQWSETFLQVDIEGVQSGMMTSNGDNQDQFFPSCIS